MNWTGLNTLKFQKIISMYRWLIQQNLWVLVHFFFLTQQNAWHKARNQAGRGAPLRSLTRRWLVNDLSGLPWPSWLLALCHACALSKKKRTWSVDFVLWRHLGTRKLQFIRWTPNSMQNVHLRNIDTHFMYALFTNIGCLFYYLYYVFKYVRMPCLSWGHFHQNKREKIEPKNFPSKATDKICNF